MNERVAMDVNPQGILLNFRPKEAPGDGPASDLEQLLRELDAMPAPTG